MIVRLEKILRQFLEYDIGVVRLGRNPNQAVQEKFLSKTLFDLEARGQAMRTLDTRGNICWKATPALRDRIADQKTEAEDELEGEDV